jgi:hypothetical protein
MGYLDPAAASGCCAIGNEFADLVLELVAEQGSLLPRS